MLDMSRRAMVLVLEHPHRSLLASDVLNRMSLRGPVWLPTRLRAPGTRKPSSSTSTSNQEKAIVLEKPDKFRPPSHPARLNARRVARSYPGPPIPQADKEAQATRKYPHMFPNKGTRMHWFLTNRYVHVGISVGTLAVLSFITLTQTFLHFSPFAHMTPNISTLPTSPLSFVRDWFWALRTHQVYSTDQVAESRQRLIIDAQKRRLYRRAHGMEDPDKDGIDLTGMEGWEDELTLGEKKRAALAAAGEAPGNGDGVGSIGKKPVRKWLGIW